VRLGFVVVIRAIRFTGFASVMRAVISVLAVFVAAVSAFTAIVSAFTTLAAIAITAVAAIATVCPRGLQGGAVEIEIKSNR